MNINHIELINIGPYEGSNLIKLETDGDRNTILIGGQNGSGKTTFLNSIKIGLYGPLAFGYKTTTENYLYRIQELLNDNAKLEKNNNNFSIKINFTIVDDFDRINVEIVRNWIYTDKKINEVVNVIVNGQLFNEIEKDNFLSKLRVTFPPALLDLCFFDGENISNLTSDKNLSSYLQELSEKLFNLDLFNSLEQHLKRYISESTKTIKELDLEKKRKKIELELKELRTKLDNTIQRLDQLTLELSNSKSSYHDIKEQFSTHGGLLFEEREQLQREIIKIEHKRKEINEQIKNFIAFELPFFISFPIFRNLVSQLDKEEDFYISNILNERLKNVSFKEIERELDIQLDEQKEERILKLFKRAVSNTNDEINIIHNASKTESHQVHSLLESLTRNRLNEIYDLIDSNNKYLRKFSSLNKQLKDQQNTSEFDEMIMLMEKYSNEISILEKQIAEQLSLKELLKEQLNSITLQYENINKELHNIFKKKSSYELTQKIINVSEKYQKSQLRKKLQDIEFFTSKMIRNLIRKKNFVHRININPETFEILLIDSEQNSINKNILSAGEKELLVLSIIWGTIRASKKQIPIVLDTLLGRLDSEHRASIISELIPSFGNQIIILSTDTEITPDLFMDLSPNISNYFTLYFDNDKKSTNIEKNFFNLKVKEVHS